MQNNINNINNINNEKYENIGISTIRYYKFLDCNYWNTDSEIAK